MGTASVFNCGVATRDRLGASHEWIHPSIHPSTRTHLVVLHSSLGYRRAPVLGWMAWVAVLAPLPLVYPLSYLELSQGRARLIVALLQG